MTELLTIEKDVQYLSKEELAVLLSLDEKEVNKAKKSELIEQFFKAFGKSKKTAKMVYETFPHRFGLTPSKVEELLEITTTERKRFEEEGKLPVVGYGSFRAYGKNIDYPFYNRLTILGITEKKIEQWREAHKKAVAKKRQASAKKATTKAVETRKRNQSLVEHFYNEEWKEMLASWYKTDEVLGASYQMAFWTVWLSRTAKHFQVKSLNAKSKKAEYLLKKEEFYQLKNEAIALLSKSPAATLSFYTPESPHKITHLFFCDHHVGLWKDMREFDYVSKWDFYDIHKKGIQACKDCTVELSKDHYSLYFLEVGDKKVTDVSFSFHTPFPIGKDFLPKKETLPKVHHEEEDGGLFRFGRSLIGNEEIIFKENEVRTYYSEAKEQFLNIIEKTKTPV